MSGEVGRTLEDILGEVTVMALKCCPSAFSSGDDPDELAKKIARFMSTLAAGIRQASEVAYGATADR